MIALTYYGHSCFSVKAGGKMLLFDPFITPNELAKGIDVSKVTADFILVSHGHADHLADAADIAGRCGATVVSTYEVVVWMQGKGVKRAHPMNHGGAKTFDFGRVKLVNAIHSSSFPDGAYAGNPCGFVVETRDGTFYYSGDTALTMDMKIVGEMHRLDFAVLPIGDNFTMGAADATRAAQWSGAKKVVGVHYDTFPPIRINKDEARATFSGLGLELLLPRIGETIEIKP